MENSNISKSPRKHSRKSKRSKLYKVKADLEDDLTFLLKKQKVDTSRQIKGLIPVSAKSFYDPINPEKLNQNESFSSKESSAEFVGKDREENHIPLQENASTSKTTCPIDAIDDEMRDATQHTHINVGKTAKVATKRINMTNTGGIQSTEVTKAPSSLSVLPQKMHTDTIPQSINSYFNSQREELTINFLIRASGYYISEAHKLVLRTNSLDGQRDYFKCIKLSIQSLLMVLKNYKQHLSPRLELSICLKLAKIYFLETENVTRADEYVNLAISISTRNLLYTIKFVSEFLSAQIIQKATIRSDTGTSYLLSKYIDKRSDFFKSIGLVNYSNLFQYLKFSNLMTVDVPTGLVILQSICNEKSVDVGTKALCLLYQSSIQLYRGSPDHVVLLLDEVKQLIEKNSLPIQVRAMHYLQLLLTLIQTARLDKSKKLMHDISKFLLQQKDDNWSGWKEDGSFNISQTHMIGTESFSTSYQVLWMNSDEFVIMFYFLTGVNMLIESHNGKNKSAKVFKKCLEIIDKQLTQLNSVDHSTERDFSISQLSKRKMRLNYLKTFINVYMCFQMNGNTSLNIKFLKEFLENYENRFFSDMELQLYQLLVPLVYYLLAIHYQANGNLHIAKEYFEKVCQLTSDQKPAQAISISLAQFDHGIGNHILRSSGKFSELHIFSLLHLLIISECEISCSSSNSSLENSYKSRTAIHESLANAFDDNIHLSKNSFNDNFVNAYPHLQILHNLIRNISTPTSSSTRSNNFEILNFQNFNWTEFFKHFPIIGGISNYISLVHTTDLLKRKEYSDKLEGILKGLPETLPDRNFLQILLLEHQILSESVFGDNDKINILRIQQDTLLQEFKARTHISI